MLAIVLPYINPVMVEIGSIPIRWYSLAYVAGFFIGAMYFKYIAKKTKIVLSKNFIDDFITAVIIGVIIGGRLGFVLIYDYAYHFGHPHEILKTWNGGMSFHGGLIGFCIAAIIVAKKHKLNILSVLDIAACCAPIGIFLGRIANFVNGELNGRVTEVPWAVIFPYGDRLPHHPSQLYEAFTEGFLLFIIINILMMKFNLYKRPGIISGLFCIFYSLFRFIVENFRQPDEQLGFIIFTLTMGQVLSIITLGVGIALVSKNIINKSN
jgi:phosphatidylglycerol:prolipoprotein diacylglycerol transferase